MSTHRSGEIGSSDARAGAASGSLPGRTRGWRIVFLCAEVFPPPYAFLDKVFNDIMRRSGLEVVWVMPSREVVGLDETTWNGSPVILIPKVRPAGLVGLVGDYWRHFGKVRDAIREADKRHGPFDAATVRDDPAMAYGAWRYSRQHGVPLVYQLSHFKEEETILFARHGLYGNRIKNQVQGRVGRALRDFLLRRADIVLPISEAMRLTLIQSGFDERQLVALPEGVDPPADPARSDPQAAELRAKLGLADRSVILYLGTMNRFRQLEFLLGVFRDLIDRHPNARLLMVGDGREPDDLPWLVARANEMGLAGKVVFTGWVAREDVPLYLRASDVGVSPIPPNPVYYNSSPIKLLEYLAWELPVVGSDLPSQTEVIEKSGAGYSVPHQHDAFLAALDRMLDLPEEERLRMGRAGRAHVKAERDFELLGRTALNAYRRVLPSD